MSLLTGRVTALLIAIVALIHGLPVSSARATDAPPALRPAVAMEWWPDARIFPVTRTDTNAVVRFPAFRPGFPWQEAVVSWNTTTLAPLTVRARAVHGTDPGPWHLIAHWSRDTNIAPRTSIPSQRNDWGWVDTDILRLPNPADAVEVEIEMGPGPDGPAVLAPDLRAGVSVLGAKSDLALPPPHRGAWGRKLSPPIRSQAEYPEGVQSWCSPTSLSMILGFWADRLDRGDLLQSVPQVARGVHDPGWPGTGNWAFNTAYAGQHRGISACVARLAGIVDLERWIESGMPVAASVSYAQLKGAEKSAAGDGHLVVVSGFTAEGDVQVHDPGVRRERVVRIVPRSDFERAWNHSDRTAYLVWPTGRPTPLGGDGRWPAR